MQHNIMQLIQDSHFSNELPQAGLEPTAFCVLGQCSTNRATEAAQLTGSYHTYEATQLNAKCLNLKIRWTVHVHGTVQCFFREGRGVRQSTNHNTVYDWGQLLNYILRSSRREKSVYLPPPQTHTVTVMLVDL